MADRVQNMCTLQMEHTADTPFGISNSALICFDMLTSVESEHAQIESTSTYFRLFRVWLAHLRTTTVEPREDEIVENSQRDPRPAENLRGSVHAGENV